jgi:hypothetical protein
MITGSAEVSGSARNRRVSSTPFIFGIIQSTTARSGAALLHQLKGLLAVLGPHHLEAVHFQVERDEARDVLVVVHHQDEVGTLLRLGRRGVDLVPDDTGAHTAAVVRAARARSLRQASAGSSAP